MSDYTVVINVKKINYSMEPNRLEPNPNGSKIIFGPDGSVYLLPENFRFDSVLFRIEPNRTVLKPSCQSPNIHILGLFEPHYLSIKMKNMTVIHHIQSPFLTLHFLCVTYNDYIFIFILQIMSLKRELVKSTAAISCLPDF